MIRGEYWKGRVDDKSDDAPRSGDSQDKLISALLEMNCVAIQTHAYTHTFTETDIHTHKHRKRHK